MKSSGAFTNYILRNLELLLLHVTQSLVHVVSTCTLLHVIVVIFITIYRVTYVTEAKFYDMNKIGIVNIA